MHRQHPYAGYSPSSQAGPGRFDSPPGPGPDRTRGSMSGRGYPPPTAPHRGRGMGRGAGPSGYHGYESPYPGPALDNPYAEDGYNNYRENGNEYGNHYENTSDIRRGGGAGRPPRREHEDKVRDPLIEERLQRERPCRTLFIRNIKYETDSNEFRLKFEEFGEIKTFFDLISHRGMVFCTYYDMRAAERAKERLQGTELAGRPIDVHYSLPRDDQKNELNQGIITVTLIDSPSRGAIDDMELRRKLTAFGDVKSIQPYNNRPESRTVEFYDLRSADEAHGKLRHQTLQDGIIETDFLFMGDQLPPPGPAMQERARQDRPGAPRGGGGGGGGRGGRGGRGRGRGGYDDRRGRDWEDEYYSRDHRRASPPRSHEDRWRERSPPPRGRMGSASESNQVDRDKMEQAKKVQDLLAALKQTSGGPAPASQPPAGYYPTSQPPPAAAAPAFGLPPHLAHIGALLQQALPPQQAQQAAAALQQYHASTNAAPAQPPYPGMAPQSYPPMPPPSAMFPGGQPASSGPYSYSPAGGLPPGNPPPGGPAAGGGYSTADIYALLERQKQAPQAPPAGALPPDSARYPYGPPGHGSQSTNSPPPAGGSAVPAHSIQDIMALLKRPS